MAYKISGTKSETARVIVFKESDWSIESNTVVSGSGAYEVSPLVSGTKTTLARTEEGELLAFGNVTPIESAPADPLPDWIRGFPTDNDYFEVVIGDQWQYSNVPFIEDETIKIYKVPGLTKWSEDGTETASPTNRLLMVLTKFGTPMVSLRLSWRAANAAETAFGNLWSGGQNHKTMSYYSFGDLFSIPYGETFGFCYTNTYSPLATNPVYYNPGAFKSMTFVAV